MSAVAGDNKYANAWSACFEWHHTEGAAPYAPASQWIPAQPGTRCKMAVVRGNAQGVDDLQVFETSNSHVIVGAGPGHFVMPAQQ